MVRELAEALERAQAEAGRSRALGELAGTIDLDEVLDAHARRRRGAAGRGRRARRGGDRRRRAARAPPSASASTSRARHPGPPDGQLPRSISIEYDHGDADGDGHIRAGLAVPLIREDEPLGYLAVYSHTGKIAFGERAAADLAELALRAGPAIENARRFREARQLADLDALTGLHNRRYFHEMLAREIARVAPLRPHAGARRLRPRRLQGGQRPDRPPRRRRGARRGGGARAPGRAIRGHRVPDRRRRVRRDPARVVARGRRPALQAARGRHLGRNRSDRPEGCTSPRA